MDFSINKHSLYDVPIDWYKGELLEQSIIQRKYENKIRREAYFFFPFIFV